MPPPPFNLDTFFSECTFMLNVRSHSRLSIHLISAVSFSFARLLIWSLVLSRFHRFSPVTYFYFWMRPHLSLCRFHCRPVFLLFHSQASLSVCLHCFPSCARIKPPSLPLFHWRYQVLFLGLLFSCVHSLKWPEIHPCVSYTIFSDTIIALVSSHIFRSCKIVSISFCFVPISCSSAGSSCCC